MYFITPNYSVAFNAKAGSATLAREIIRNFYPEIEARIQGAHYPADKGPDSALWHGLVPKEKEPSKPVVVIVREPVDRFKSAVAFMRLDDVDGVLDSLEGGSDVTGSKGRKFDAKENPHFLKQVSLITPGANVFKLEEIDSAAELIGMGLPLIVANESQNEKPTLTPEQQSRIVSYYADDIAMYSSL